MKSFKLNTRVGALAANLYLPKNVTNPPVVIVTGAWTTVKEQMPAIYAKELTNNGFAAITFDFRGWGQSKDKVQYLEDPARKTEDIRSVIDALSQINEVDSTKVFGIGICASTGYMLDAISNNDNVLAGAAVAPWIHNQAIAEQMYGGAESVNNLIALAEEQSHQSTFIEAASTENENSLMYQAPYYTETKRGLISQYDNLFNVASWKPWLTYDALAGAKTQSKPVLLVGSEAMALPIGTHQYLEQAGDNVTALWLDNVSQFDFYDTPKYVKLAVEAIVKHFIHTMK